jgi:integrase
MYYFNIGESYQSDATRNTHLTTVKTFIKHVYSRRLIELPRNLSSSEYRFSISAHTITTFTIEQISQLLEKAEGQTKLHILLGLNCGMGAGDIASLSQDDVEWTNGIVTRIRSKTRKHKNTPTVSYRLWTPTLALLREFNSGGNPVLQTKTGGVWAGSEVIDGVFHKTNQLSHAFARLVNACGIKGLSHYNLRKTSATLLETHETYGRLVPHFLGHAPQSMASKHYAAPSPELFDKAIAWPCQSRLGREPFSRAKVSQLSSRGIAVVRRNADIRSTKTRLARCGRRG